MAAASMHINPGEVASRSYPVSEAAPLLTLDMSLHS